MVSFTYVRFSQIDTFDESVQSAQASINSSVGMLLSILPTSIQNKFGMMIMMSMITQKQQTAIDLHLKSQSQRQQMYLILCENYVVKHRLKLYQNNCPSDLFNQLHENFNQHTRYVSLQQKQAFQFYTCKNVLFAYNIDGMGYQEEFVFCNTLNLKQVDRVGTLFSCAQNRFRAMIIQRVRFLYLIRLYSINCIEIVDCMLSCIYSVTKFRQNVFKAFMLGQRWEWRQR
eukprot:TRINITY_DN3263_c0_g1_i9.p2 TRINITY_DN3263_c0_g1~~TRINITY_DN3263_c0_g1_i9.p2  ORF type:complete len:229 (-),score=4.03 TRINITY_DN3263_c0_g1_i9:17-703(-)